MIGFKVCSSCKINKEVIDFYKCFSKADNLQTYCKDCQYKSGLSDLSKKAARKSKLKTKYNLTEDQYRSLLIKQQNCCAICRAEVNLEVDHDHNTGEIRGLLCRFCNRGLGFFRDNKDHILCAIKYLEEKQLLGL